VHILDGHLPVELWGTGAVACGVLTAATLPSLVRASPPRVAMMTSAFFVASLLHVGVAGTSLHLSLLALTGIVLGRAAFPAVLVGVCLQKVLFQHGGYTTIGVNAFTMGSGALVAAAVYRVGLKPGPGSRLRTRAALAAGLGTLAALSLFGVAMLLAGEALRSVAWVVLVLHLPVILLEVLLAVQVVAFLDRVQPELIRPPLPLAPCLDSVGTEVV
jgi:cobalt/nickel transport system permease protein